MICFSIYTRAGSFVQRFETLERAELWRRFMGVTQYTIRKEKW